MLATGACSFLVLPEVCDLREEVQPSRCDASKCVTPLPPLLLSLLIKVHGNDRILEVFIHYG